MYTQEQSSDVSVVSFETLKQITLDIKFDGI